MKMQLFKMIDIRGVINNNENVNVCGRILNQNGAAKMVLWSDSLITLELDIFDM